MCIVVIMFFIFVFNLNFITKRLILRRFFQTGPLSRRYILFYEFFDGSLTKKKKNFLFTKIIFEIFANSTLIFVLVFDWRKQF